MRNKKIKKIVIIGAGGFAREVRWLIEDINKKNKEFEFIGYVLSDLKKIKATDSKELILGDYSWFDSINESVAVVIGVGNPKHRLRIGGELSKIKKPIFFPNLIHPSVLYQSSTCTFGKGIIICANTVLTVNINLGNFVMINLSCIIGHESVIGEGTALNPFALIGGGSQIGEGVLIGTGATILQYLSIGDFSTIGASACVTKSTASNILALGIPAKIIS